MICMINNKKVATGKILHLRHLASAMALLCGLIDLP